MSVEIKVPKMGESIVEVTIGEILKPTGSLVKADEEIIEIETEKVNQVLPSPQSGKVEWKVQKGDKAKIGDTIGTIVPSSGEGEKTTSEVPSKEKEPKASEKQAPIEEKQAKDTEQAPKKGGKKLRKNASDFAEELKQGGSAQKSSAQEPPVQEPSDQEPSGERARVAQDSAKEKRRKMSSLRKTIAKRLVEVKNETAMLTTFNEVDMGTIIALRSEHQEAFKKKHGVKLGFMSFFIKAVVSALQMFPDLNSWIDGEEIVTPEYYHIGIAVGTDKGLFVPVVRDADKLSYADIEKRLKEYAEKAKKGTISVDDMRGGTFTITNGGVYGSMLSTPILNPPQSAILGMHNIVKRAVVIEEKIDIRPMMYLALSYDHRIVDGKESISFLLHVKKKLEEPERFLLDL